MDRLVLCELGLRLNLALFKIALGLVELGVQILDGALLGVIDQHPLRFDERIQGDAGAVYFNGARIDGLKTYEIARRGIGRTFQSVKIFRELSVWDNLSIAAMGRERIGWEPTATAWLERLGLDHLREDPGESLSVGQQRLLEVAMNLVVDPPFLMLDEPLAGVHPVVRQRIAETIRALRQEGRTFLIIEHDMAFVMELCDKLVVMDHGLKIAEGAPEAIRRDPAVIDALLGRRRDPALA